MALRIFSRSPSLPFIALAEHMHRIIGVTAEARDRHVELIVELLDVIGQHLFLRIVVGQKIGHQDLAGGQNISIGGITGQFDELREATPWLW